MILCIIYKKTRLVYLKFNGQEKRVAYAENGYLGGTDALSNTRIVEHQGTWYTNVVSAALYSTHDMIGFAHISSLTCDGITIGIIIIIIISIPVIHYKILAGMKSSLGVSQPALHIAIIEYQQAA